MNQPLSGDSQEDQGTFNQLVSACSHLLEACNVYTGRNARTSSGKVRQHIVSQIKTQAEQDFAHLRDFSDRMSSLPPEQRPKIMVEALGMARTRVLTLKAGRASQLHHVGGAVSYLGCWSPNLSRTKRPPAFLSRKIPLISSYPIQSNTFNMWKLWQSGNRNIRGSLLRRLLWPEKPARSSIYIRMRVLGKKGLDWPKVLHRNYRSLPPQAGRLKNTSKKFSMLMSPRLCLSVCPQLS